MTPASRALPVINRRPRRVPQASPKSHEAACSPAAAPSTRHASHAPAARPRTDFSRPTPSAFTTRLCVSTRIPSLTGSAINPPRSANPRSTGCGRHHRAMPGAGAIHDPVAAPNLGPASAARSHRHLHAIGRRPRRHQRRRPELQPACRPGCRPPRHRSAVQTETGAHPRSSASAAAAAAFRPSPDIPKPPAPAGEAHR